MVTISAEVEIQASPETVRSVFMNFSRYKEWSKWTFTPADSSTKPDSLKAGDKLQVDLGSMKFQPLVLDNSATRFQWEGKMEPIFSGIHEFRFAPSTKTAGGTTFTQTEEFRGLLSFLMRPGWSFSNSTLENWQTFNQDLKEEVERSSQQKE
ncbi:hypothetical protein E8E14_009155 [Neopestalotiopsis sp. 37M]|nr:hypothetical protein E8E14_009155 [Neopestalotiopsis sp. 37M]